MPRNTKTSRRPRLMRALTCVTAALAFVGLVAGVAFVLHNDMRPPRPPKNVIFMVSDGFGEAGLTLARLYKNTEMYPRPRDSRGQPAPMVPLYLDAFATGNSHTYSASSLVTDSAAGATAWACGLKTNNLYVGTDPFDQPCGTLMEAAKAKGLSTGVAVTSSVTDATPASFATHARRRKLQYSIAKQYCARRTADVILGGGRQFFQRQGLLGGANCSGLPYVYNASGLAAASSAPLLGLFAEDDLPWEIDRDKAAVPSLKEMALKAVHLLQEHSGGADAGRGFFLLVEGSKIDKAAHPNDVGSHLREILAYDEAVGAMLNFARLDGQTLVISVADHETGGLSLGRGTIVANPARPERMLEGPLHTRSLVAEAEGISDTAYSVHLGVLTNQTASAEAMTARALASVGNPDGAALAADPALRGRLVDALVGVLRTHAGLESLLEVERTFVREAVELFVTHRDAEGHDGEGFPARPLGSYGVRRALGSIVSARAKIGWSSFGHSGEDVKLHAYGVGSEHFHGAIENAEIGRRVARLLGVDLDAVTGGLGTPPMSALDRSGEWAAFVDWLPKTTST
jgi:alkaline phosphatase